MKRLSTIAGALVSALDGDLGTVGTFYFDEEAWTVRYALVAAGPWLFKREVLVSIMSLLPPDWRAKRLPTCLRREQVRRAPDVYGGRPVSRAQEAALLSHYAYPFYWTGPALWGAAGDPATAAQPTDRGGRLGLPASERERRLRSTREVTGLSVNAVDGEVGHVADLVVNPVTWTIAFLLVEAGEDDVGTVFVVPCDAIGLVSWAERRVSVLARRKGLITQPPEGQITNRGET